MRVGRRLQRGETDEGCRPRSARSLLRRLLEGQLHADTCALCFCGETLRPLTETINVQVTGTQHRVTLGDLVDLIPSNDAICSNKWIARKICKACINRLLSFYTFSEECTKAVNALRNIKKFASKQTIASNLKNRHRGMKKKIILPYKDIYKYADYNLIDNIYKSSLQRNTCMICRITFKTYSEMSNHFEIMHNKINTEFTEHTIETIQNSFFDCNICSLKKISWCEFTEHKEIHDRERVIRNIIKNKHFCICCLREKDDLVSLSLGMFYAGSKIPINMEEMLYQILNISALDTYKPSLICEECIDRTMNAHTFKAMLQQSCTTIKNSIMQFEENVEKVKSMKPMEGKVNLYFDCGSIRIKTECCDQNTNYFDHASDLDSDNDIDLPLSKVKKNIKMSRKYECSICNGDFQMLKDFKKHRKVHGENEKHVCRCCLKTFSSIKRLSSHRKKKHLLSPLCPVCSLVTKRTNLKIHMVIKHGSHLLSCDHCKKKFYSKSSIKKHIFSKHVINMQKECRHCGKSVSNLLMHKCKDTCSECSEYPCIHQKYLVAFKSDQTLRPKEQYKCIECDFKYNFKHQILAHANKKHLLHYPHFCDSCTEKFASKEDLKSHIDIKHRKYFNCPHCYKAFKDQSFLVQHIQECETVDKPFKCDLCSASFTSEDKMSFHRRKHFPKNFKCDLCSGKYWTKSELNGHLKRSHKESLGPEKSLKKVYQCTMCPLDFFFKKELVEHVTLHAADSRHVCRICNVSFRSKVNYYGHLRRHNIKKDNECPVCGKLYTKYNMATHLKSHEEKKKISEVKTEKVCSKNTMCDVCGRFLANQTSLIKHREIHKEQDQCPHCLKFVNSTIFERHLRNHDNAYGPKYKSNRKNRKNFNCTKCEYSSIFADCLEAHENRFHLHVRPFKCDICNKAFYAKITLKEHIRTHSGTKPEQCEQCGNRFVSKKALRLHVRIHTGERPYPCDLCNEKFLSASRRQAHRIRKHFEPSVQCQICLKMYYTQSAVRIHIRDYHSGEPRQRGKKKRV